MSEAALPAAFRELEPYLDWALRTEQERRARRVASSMSDILTFHSAMSLHLEAIIVHLNQYPYPELPADAERLFHLSLSLVEVANLVEMYKRPEIMNVMDPQRFRSYE